jgi:uncharacterized membrane protein YphA (DoxX/SURF4 family)
VDISKVRGFIFNAHLAAGARILLGTLFIYAGISKIIDPFEFAKAISNYLLVPSWSVNFLAITLPWVEVISGFMLLLGLWTRENTIIILGLLFIFLIALIQAMVRNIDLECGCFGGTERKVGISTLLQDILLVLIGVYIYVFDDNIWSLKPRRGNS